MKKNVVAIDGPAGAGKSTIAKIVAKKLGYLYLDTGAMYRAVTWNALRQKADFHDPKLLTRIAKQTKIEFVQDHKKKLLQVFVNGEEITQKIRTEKVSRHTNAAASVPGVRTILRNQQRRIGQNENIVMEGRDIGTAVFPKAEIKFYLDASPMERAKRRYKELKARGKKVSLEHIAHAIAQRDYRDKHRSASPLKKAADAIVIDSTRMTLKQVADHILKMIKVKQEARGLLASDFLSFFKRNV